MSKGAGHDTLHYHGNIAELSHSSMWWWQTQFKAAAVYWMLSIRSSPFSIKTFYNVKIRPHKITEISRSLSAMLDHVFWIVYVAFFYFSPFLSLFCLCVFTILFPLLISSFFLCSLFTLIKTLSFTDTLSAWVSLTDLTMVTEQSPVYILPRIHHPLSF